MLLLDEQLRRRAAAAVRLPRRRRIRSARHRRSTRSAPAPALRRDAPGDQSVERRADRRSTSDRGPALARRRQRGVPRPHGRCAAPAAAISCCSTSVPSTAPTGCRIVVPADPADAARAARRSQELLADLLGTDPSIAGTRRPHPRAHRRQSVLHRGGGADADRVGAAPRRRGAYRLVTPIERARGAGHRAGGAGGAHRPAAEREKRVLQSRGGDRQGLPRAAAGGGRGAARRRAEGRARGAAARRVHPRAGDLPGGRVRLQASADAGGGARQPAQGAAPPGARRGGARHRAAAPRASRRTRRAAGAPLGAGRRGAAPPRAGTGARRNGWALPTSPPQRTTGGGCAPCTRELPDDREAAALGIAACMQLLNMGWRVGGGTRGGSRRLLEEGQAFARSIGDRIAAVYLSMVYGRRCAAPATWRRTSSSMFRTSAPRSSRRRRRCRPWRGVGWWTPLCFGSSVSRSATKWPMRGSPASRFMSPDGQKVMGIHPTSRRCRSGAATACNWMGRLQEAARRNSTSLVGMLATTTARRRWPPMPGSFIAEAHYLAHDAERALASARQARGDQPRTRRTADIGRTGAARVCLGTPRGRAARGRHRSGACVARSPWASGTSRGGQVRGAARRGPAAGR